MDHFIFYNTSFTKLLFPLDPKSCSILSRIEIVPIVSIIGEEAWKKLLARENRWNSSIRISIGGLMGRIATLAGNVQSSAISRALVPFSLGSRIPGPKWALTKGLRGREKVEGKWESPRNEPGNRKYYVQLECRQPYAALCATCHENRLKPPCNLSFSLVLFFKRNLFSFATKTRLIWNLDFKNNFRKGILFLNRIRNFYSFLKEREIYIETLQWRGNLQICVRASIRKIRNNNNVAWIISLRQHQLLLFFVCFFFFALLLPGNFTSPRENNFIPLFAKVD